MTIQRCLDKIEAAAYHRNYRQACIDMQSILLESDAQADDLLAALAERNIHSRGDLDLAFRRAAYNPSLDEALNTGDGTYRP